MAVNIVQLRQNLVRDLAGIKEKWGGDHQWFYLSRDKTLHLYPRPAGRIERIWECVCRFFHTIFYGNKLITLSRKFQEITSQVDTYLSHEKDSNQKTTFINAYHNALNDVYHAATSIAKKYSLPPPSTQGVYFSTLLSEGPRVQSRFTFKNKTPNDVEVAITLPGSSVPFRHTALRHKGFSFPTEILCFPRGQIELKAQREGQFRTSERNDYCLIIHESGYVESKHIPAKDVYRCFVNIENKTSWEVFFRMDGGFEQYTTPLDTQEGRVPPKSTEQLQLRKKFTREEQDEITLKQHASDATAFRVASILDEEVAYKGPLPRNAVLHEIKYHVSLTKKAEVPLKSQMAFYEYTLEQNLSLTQFSATAALNSRDIDEQILTTSDTLRINLKEKKPTRVLRKVEKPGIALVNGSSSPMEVVLKITAKQPPHLSRHQLLNPEQTLRFWIGRGEILESPFPTLGVQTPELSVSGTIQEWKLS